MSKKDILDGYIWADGEKETIRITLTTKKLEERKKEFIFLGWCVRTTEDANPCEIELKNCSNLSLEEQVERLHDLLSKCGSIKDELNTCAFTDYDLLFNYFVIVDPSKNGFHLNRIEERSSFIFIRDNVITNERFIELCEIHKREVEIKRQLRKFKEETQKRIEEEKRRQIEERAAKRRRPNNEEDEDDDEDDDEPYLIIFN